MSLTLTPRQRAALKAQAHALDPVVHVGQAGLSTRVVQELDRALTAHGLIKVRIGDADRHGRAALAAEAAERVDAAVVQAVGRIVTLWRPRPDEEGTPATKRP